MIFAAVGAFVLTFLAGAAWGGFIAIGWCDKKLENYRRLLRAQQIETVRQMAKRRDNAPQP